MAGNNETPKTAADYLYVLIKRSSLFEDEYKQMAEKYQGNLKVLKELFACANDKVSIEILKLAETQEAVDEAFKKARMKHFEEIYVKKYHEELKLIKNGFEQMTSEVRSLSGKVDTLNDSFPNIEEMFFQAIPYYGQKTQDVFVNEISEEKELTVADAKNLETDITISSETVNDSSEELSQKADNVEQAQMIQVPNEKKDLDKTAYGETEKVKGLENNSFINNLKNSLGLTLRKINYKPSKFIQSLYDEEYTDEQIDIIIKWLNEGYSENEIKKFVSKKMSVTQMEMMKKIYDKSKGV